MAKSDNERRNLISTVLIVLVGQVGCLTLIIIIFSVLAGIWLDTTFHTKPMLTLALLFIGIPISVIVMLFVARKTLVKLKAQNEK